MNVSCVMPVMKALLVTLCLAASPALAWAQASRVLVMPFAVEVAGESPGGAGTAFWLGEASALLLEEQLRHLGIGTFARDERVAGFDRLQLPMSSTLTRATMIRAAEVLGASHLVFGDVRLGQTLSVKARVVQLAAGKERPAVSDAAPMADIFGLFQRVAERMAKVSDLRPLPASPPDSAPLSLEAFENYVKGLVAATPAAQQRFLETALRLSPGDPRVLLALWKVYADQELHEKALAAANSVAATSLYARQARFAVALSLVSLKRLDGAFQELSTLATQRGASAISNALGVVQLRRGAPAGSLPATAYFKRAVDAEPDNTSYLFNLGYAHALAPNATEALAWLREAVRFNAADGDAHFVMSGVLASSGRQAEAQRELDLARLLGATLDVAAGPPVARVPRGLERLVAELDARPAHAPASATPAQRDQQDTAAFHLARARNFMEQHNDRVAINELRRAIYLSPYDDQPHLLLGQLYRRGGQLTEAIDEFKVALWSRESVEAHVALGDALLDAGEKDAARRAAERAVVLAPTNASARDLLKRTGG